MSTGEAAFRVLGLALTAGLTTYAYSHWYYRFALSRREHARAKPLLLRALVLPPALVVLGAFLFLTFDKPLFRLICDTELLFFGAPISILFSSVPAFLKMNAALKFVGMGKPERPLSQRQVRIVISLLYFVALSFWLMPLKATHLRDVILLLAVALGFTVLRFALRGKLVAHVSGEPRVLALQLATHVVIVSWLFVANAIYRAI